MKRKRNAKAPLSVKLPAPLAADIAEAAAREGRSLAAQVRWLLAAALTARKAGAP